MCKGWPAKSPRLGAPVIIHSTKGQGSEVHKLECNGETVVVTGQPLAKGEKQQAAQTCSFPGDTMIQLEVAEARCALSSNELVSGWLGQPG